MTSDELRDLCLAQPGAEPGEGGRVAPYPEDASVSAYIGRHGWNVLRIGGAIPDDDIRAAVDESYDRVVACLPARRRPSS